WFWITLELTVPPVAALLFAFPFWRKGGMIFGNIAGMVVIFGTAFGLIFREYAELDRATKACLDAGFVCWPMPGAFTRFAVYASVGLLEVFALFVLSLSVERKLRNRDYAPEWR
ncbi:MAG: hypothetical protein ABI818_12645, partial [Acidobacteriota bacterium]